MDRNSTLEQIRQMPVDDRIWLVQEIWDSIPVQSVPGPTEEQLKELERRWADDEAHPEDSIPWEIVYAEAMARIRK